MEAGARAASDAFIADAKSIFGAAPPIRLARAHHNKLTTEHKLRPLIAINCKMLFGARPKARQVRWHYCPQFSARHMRIFRAHSVCCHGTVSNDERSLFLCRSLAVARSAKLVCTSTFGWKNGLSGGRTARAEKERVGAV